MFSFRKLRDRHLADKTVTQINKQTTKRYTDTPPLKYKRKVFTPVIGLLFSINESSTKQQKKQGEGAYLEQKKWPKETIKN